MIPLRKPIIGLITGTSFVPEKEFHEQLAGIANIATTRVSLFQISYSHLEKMIAQLPAAVEILAASSPDVIVWNSMTGSCLHSYETVNMLEQKTGVPVLIPSLEFVHCLQELNAQRIALVSPHGVELNLLEKIFFDRYQISVEKVVSLLENSAGDVHLIDRVTTEDVLSHVAQSDFSDVDAVVFDNPACSMASIAEELERLISKPILPHNQVLMRAALRRLGLPSDIIFIDKYFPKTS